MYSPLNTKAGTVQSGAATVSGDLAQFQVQLQSFRGAPPDGLEVDTSTFLLPGTAVLPQRLYDWLRDLQLLRNIPLCYLVPDSALLPPESIRFFNVDRTWVERVIDGVFAAANTGTVDITYSVAMIDTVRATITQDRQWWQKEGLTGMLIRSDLVRRWPDMISWAFTGNDGEDGGYRIARRADFQGRLHCLVRRDSWPGSVARAARGSTLRPGNRRSENVLLRTAESSR